MADAKARALAEVAALRKLRDDAAAEAELADLRLKAAVAYYGPRGTGLLELPELAEALGRHLSRPSVWGRQVALNHPTPGRRGPGTRGPGMRDLMRQRLGWDPLTDYRHPDLDPEPDHPPAPTPEGARP